MSINTILNLEEQKIMENNRKVIESLFHVVILCGVQGLPFCGHRDDNIDWETEECFHNEGNFIQLVYFCAETDAVLATHLLKAPRHSTYTSKTIQNELIHLIGGNIRNEILDEVKSAQYYAVIADEVTDSVNKEELSIVLRYVWENTVKEVFLNFIEVERITGKVLGNSILNWLKLHGLSPSNMCGQCYDGASNMTRARSGCREVLNHQASLAFYFHCAAHQLNMAIVSACSIQAFKNTESYLGDDSKVF